MALGQLQDEADLERLLEARNLPRLSQLQGADALLRLAIAGDRIANFGMAILTWAGVLPVSESINIAHGLGKAPLSAFATPQSQPSTGIVAVSISGAWDATNLLNVHAEVVGGGVPAAASTVPIAWLAIG